MALAGKVLNEAVVVKGLNLNGCDSSADSGTDSGSVSLVGGLWLILDADNAPAPTPAPITRETKAGIGTVGSFGTGGRTGVGAGVVGMGAGAGIGLLRLQEAVYREIPEITRAQAALLDRACTSVSDEVAERVRGELGQLRRIITRDLTLLPFMPLSKRVAMEECVAQLSRLAVISNPMLDGVLPVDEWMKVTAQLRPCKAPWDRRGEEGKRRRDEK